MPTNGSSSVSEQPEEEIRFRKGANWIPDNVKTLMQWIHISAIYIDILGESTKLYKRILRASTIINLVLSSFASTITISQYSDVTNQILALDWVVKGLVTLSTIAITINAGYLKVYNIQEKVEKAIRLQQQWIDFGTAISSELQLPVEHRKDALFFIIKMKETYTALIKQHIVANRRILKKIANKNGVAADVLTLSDLLERSIQSEAARIDEEYFKTTNFLRGMQKQDDTESDRRNKSDKGDKDDKDDKEDKVNNGDKTDNSERVAIPIRRIASIHQTSKPEKIGFVPSVAKLLQARQSLRKTVLTSPRSSISNYVMKPSFVRSESENRFIIHPLTPIEEDSDAGSVETVKSNRAKVEV